MKKIGVTGGIGAGKTSFCNILSQEGGHPIISADEQAKKALHPHSPCYPSIMKILNYPSSITTAMNQIFSNSKLKEQIESIMHPYIFQLILEEEKKLQNHPMIFYEIPLLFEKNLEDHFQFIVLITCSEQIRKERIQKRSHLSESEIIHRIRTQIPEEKKREKSHFIIENNSTLIDLKHKAKQLLKQLESIDKP